jgi:hypothetical protein
LAGSVKFNFSHRFSGTIWKMIAAPEQNLLFLEVRIGDIFQVEFSALDYKANRFVWKDWRMKESWWIGLTAANNQTLLLHTFVNKGNPDHKNLIACDIFNQVVRWEVDEFSFYDWDEQTIYGYSTKGDITPAQIQLESGEVIENPWESIQEKPEMNSFSPVQFLEGTQHFETVQRFIQQRLNKAISKGVEYVEFDNWIVVSVYIQESEDLANYLIVMTKEGEIVLEEKLGEKLEGLGVDTFFILSGCLFFVKNRLELVAYTFYD